MEKQTLNLRRNECVQAVTLDSDGSSFRQIGRRLGVLDPTSSRVVQRHREKGSYVRRWAQGGNRRTTAIQDRFYELQF